MNTADKAMLVEETLMRAAEQLGDITPAAMAAYYRHCPEAQAAFEAHGLGKRAHLEGMMIENSLHCLMHWIESPGEIEILLSNSVPHHKDTLHIPPAWYGDLLETTAEVIAATIPDENSDEIRVWSQLRTELRTFIDGCCPRH